MPLGFGKKPEPPAPPGGGNSGGGGSALPWVGWPDEIGCNFALAHLTQALHARVTIDGRIHAETLLCVAAGVAGVGAHASLMVDPNLPALKTQPNAFVTVGMADGRQLLYGDAINAMLSSSDPKVAPCRVWNLLAGTAIANRLNQEDLPRLEDMFGYVAKSLGGPREGLPSIGNEPAAPVGVMLESVWPMARDCLTGEINETTRKNGFAAARTSWVAVTARAAASVYAQVLEVIDPKTALVMAFESAVYASKLPQAN